jgi:hypothetical protein
MSHSIEYQNHFRPKVKGEHSNTQADKMHINFYLENQKARDYLGDQM